MNVPDPLNNSYGIDALFVAGEGIAPKWRMCRDMLIPQYTTNSHDIPKLEC